MATCDFLLVGCEGCGKTTLLKQLNYMTKNVLSDESVLNTLPTNGVELETINFKKHKYVVREIGGNFLPVWPKYYESSLMVIFMIDMANYSQLPITCVEFLNLLCNKGLYKKSILLLLNKVDQPYAMTRAMLEHIFFLEATKKEAYTKFGQSIWVEEVSAAKGLGLDKVLFWMHDTKRSIAPGASPKSSPKGSPKGPSSSPKGLYPQPTNFFPSYANNTIYEQIKVNPYSPSLPSTTNINTNNNTNNNNNNNTNNNTAPSPRTSATSPLSPIAIAKQKDKIPHSFASPLSVLYNPHPPLPTSIPATTQNINISINQNTNISTSNANTNVNNNANINNNNSNPS